jgi:DNA ligase-1
MVSPKLDGIRLRIDPILNGVSRTHKPIPNAHLQHVIIGNISWMKYLDGEIIIGDPVAPDVFNKTQSAVMSQGGQPSLQYYIFDHWFNPTASFAIRYSHAKDIFHTYQSHLQEAGGQLHLVPQDIAQSPEDVLKAEAKYLTEGYEGVILRDPRAPYKNGRSTFKEQILLKFKRVADAEAVIVGFEPLERNLNEQTRDAFGLAKRSSHRAGKVADRYLGNLLVEHPTWGKFSIGSGFDVATREHIWNNQEAYKGKTVSFKYQPIGMKDKPRFPIYKGLRHD